MAPDSYGSQVELVAVAVRRARLVEPKFHSDHDDPAELGMVLPATTGLGQVACAVWYDGISYHVCPRPRSL